jgi:YHS domain-containing protein
MMRRFSAAIALACCLAACRQETPRSASGAAHDIKTIDSTDPRPTVIDPPPLLAEEGPAIKPKNQPGAFADAPAPLTEKDEQVRAALPFVPAIAMDPVNGSKVSIRADTPTFEFKGHLYYFSTPENMAEFRANPEQFMKGLRI